MTTYKRAVAITPNDATDLTTPVKVIMVGTNGTIKVNFTGVGSAITLTLIAGHQYPINAKRVYSTGTTATGIIGFY